MEDTDKVNIDKARLSHPKEKSFFLSRLFYCWQIPIIYRNFKKELTVDELYAPLKEYDSSVLAKQLNDVWEKEKCSHKNPSLWRVLVKCYGVEYIKYAIFVVIGRLLLVLLQPYFMKEILKYFTSKQTTQQQALQNLGGLILLTLVQSITFHYTNLGLKVLGMKIRIACSSLLYKKFLSFSKSNLNEFSQLGKMLNLVSNDVNRFDVAFLNSPNLVNTPVEIAITAYLLYYFNGYTASLGVTIFLAVCGFQVLISHLIVKVRKQIVVRTDVRLQLMNEVVSGIQVIKMFSWEEKFKKLIGDARSDEMKQMFKANFIRLLSFSLIQSVTTLSLFVDILVAILVGRDITAQYVYVTYAYFAIIKISTSVSTPLAVQSLSDAHTTILRIEEFLLLNDQRQLFSPKKKCNPKTEFSYIKTEKPIVSDDKPKEVLLESVTAKWSISSSLTSLENINFEARFNNLVGVIGAAGSGKSTLIYTILKETAIVKGKVIVNGQMSFASQEAWIYPGSVKQNILFGEKMNEDRFAEVVKVCGLEHDLSMFSHGRSTLVGERGVMLSGGQKARISLARAIYKKADIYLLDDPLSAVDSQVAKHIFEKCITDFLGNKCVVLVTHQTQFLKTADQIYILDKGKVAACGTYEELSKDCKNGMNRLLENESSNSDGNQDVIYTKKEDVLLESKEESSGERFLFSIFQKYFLAGSSSFSFLVLIVLFLLTQGAVNGTDYFLTFYLNTKEAKASDQDVINAQNVSEVVVVATTNTFLTTNNFLIIYTAVIVSLIMLISCRTLLFVRIATNASKNLHDVMFSKIIYGTMQFFNLNTSGRILNRFSKDIGMMDEALPQNLVTANVLLFNIIGGIVIVIISNYYAAIPSAFFFGVTLTLIMLFLATFKNARKLDAVTRSPLFTHLSNSMQGSTTIRALGREKLLCKEFDDHQNLNCTAFYLREALMAGFVFWTDMFCICYMAVVTFGIFFFPMDNFSATVGLIITQIVLSVYLVQPTMRNFSEIDTGLISVERIQEYTELETEDFSSTDKPPELWPKCGNIELKSVALKYSDDGPWALKKISVKINAGEKIGIVGRTGSGKSSLTATLFRLHDFEGKILIDGVDIKKISLTELRPKIGIIPQDPVLFSGTLRKNLDPFNENADFEIWEALDEVQMKNTIFRLPGGLETSVSDGGSNFSVGEKQLLCLVRVILRNCKILILDEVTANIDLKTDELIQMTIRKKFKNSTVLTIAHRLHTVIDSDKILVMNDGYLVEFDHPHRLLQNADGFFYSLVNQNETSVARDLKNIVQTKSEHQY